MVKDLVFCAKNVQFIACHSELIHIQGKQLYHVHFCTLFNGGQLLKEKKKVFKEQFLSSLEEIDKQTACHKKLWGWSGGAMVLGKLPVPGRPAYLD